MPATKDTPHYRLPTPGTALVEKSCLNCLARFEYIQKTKYRDFCCDRCKTQYHNRKKTSAIVTTNISLTKKLRKIRSFTARKEFLTNLVYQFARYKCGLPTEWGPDARVYSEAISNTKLFGKNAQAENDKVKDNVYSDFMKEAMERTDGRDVYCPLTLADAFGLHGEIEQAGLPAPERRKSRRKHQATTARTIRQQTPTPTAPDAATDRPTAPNRAVSRADRADALKALTDYTSAVAESDRENITFEAWASSSGYYYADDVPALFDNVKYFLLELEDPSFIRIMQ